MRKRVWISASGLALVVLTAAGIFGWLARFRNTDRAVPILMYHQISDKESKWCVSPENFEAQMRFLREEGYVSILPADLAANRRWGKPLPARPVIITFDDGYLDVMTEAEPILKKYGLRGIVYLITEYVAAEPAQRRQFAGADCLTWPEVRDIRRRGVLTFGGHSRTHASLVRSPDPLAETNRCLADIERFGGFPADAFCYPYGQCRDGTAEAVRRAGFSTALICGDEVAAWGADADLYRLPRVSVMGGAKSFSVTRRHDESSPDPVFDLEYEGVDMRVSPCLLRVGAETDRRWHEAIDLQASRPHELRWPAEAEDDGTRPLRVEIWDANRVLRLYAQTFD